MSICNKLKFYYATCFFCQNKGLCLSAKNNNGEIPVCEDCSRKLIAGVSTALEELDRMNAERAAATNATEPAPVDEPVQTETSNAVPVAEEATHVEVAPEAVPVLDGELIDAEVSV